MSIVNGRKTKLLTKNDKKTQYVCASASEAIANFVKRLRKDMTEIHITNASNLTNDDRADWIRVATGRVRKQTTAISIFGLRRPSLFF